MSLVSRVLLAVFSIPMHILVDRARKNVDDAEIEPYKWGSFLKNFFNYLPGRA